MARPLRIEFENCMYHITSRGIEKNIIFKRVTDRKRFLEYLEEDLYRFNVYLYAYVLMDNHYHLFIQTTKPNLSHFMHNLNTAYSVYFNKKYHRVGHLFQGRFKAIIVDKDTYLLELIRYIHLNPVKAAMVSLPEEYRWSSYREYIGQREKKIVKTDWLEGYFGKNGVKKFIRFTNEGIKKEINPFKNLKASLILGSDAFVDKIRGKIPIIKENKEIPSYKLLKEISVDEILKDISTYYNVSETDLLKRRKGNIPRMITIYFIRNLSSLKLKEIAKIFNVSESGISRAAQKIKEDMKSSYKIRKDIKEIREIISAKVKT